MMLLLKSGSSFSLMKPYFLPREGAPRERVFAFLLHRAIDVTQRAFEWPKVEIKIFETSLGNYA